MVFGKKSGLDRALVESALEDVNDPTDGVALSSRLRDVEDGKTTNVVIELPTPVWASRLQVAELVKMAIGKRAPDANIDVRFSFDVKPARPQGSAQSLIPKAKNIILFASGKGGVGKSTVAANVASALAKAGASVGLLDADIYGPSVPTMLGVSQRPEVMGQKLIPVEKFGMKLMSIGFIVDPKQAMSWRGPMLNGALTQFMRDVEWDELDYLVLDLPPGTGDVQLTIAQNLKVAGAVLVSTPQDVALADVIRGKAMFDKVDVPVLGIVENMASFVCGSCGAEHHIFSSGGAGRLATELGVPLLAEVPLEQATRESADLGEPEVLRNPDSAASKVFTELASRIGTSVAVTAAQQSVKPGRGLKIIQ